MVSVAWLFAAVVGWLAVPASHPTHTSAAELSQEAGEVASVVIRLFADDIGETLGAPPGQKPTGEALRSYLADRFVILDRSGTRVALGWDDGMLSGDVLELRSRTRVTGELTGAQVTNRVLTERFPDQVNVVRATYAGRSTTLIFTRGDGPKALP
jgi:hypothetical protein